MTTARLMLVAWSLSACPRPAADQASAPPSGAPSYELELAYASASGFVADWDINLKNGGTFIKTSTPLPVGTVVRMKLTVPGVVVPFDLTGRAIRLSDAGSENGMGVMFVDFDDEKRRRLAKLVEELRR